jgi:phosphatidylserine synthase
MSSDEFFAGLPIIFAGFLPTACYLTAVALTSCLFLTSYSSGMMPLKEVSELNTGDWSSSDAPHKYTPMLGVLATEDAVPSLEVVSHLRVPAEPWRSSTR